MLKFLIVFLFVFRCDYSQYAPQLIRAFIMLFTSKDEVILQQAWNALAAVTKNMDADEQVKQFIIYKYFSHALAISILR